MTQGALKITQKALREYFKRNQRAQFHSGLMMGLDECSVFGIFFALKGRVDQQIVKWFGSKKYLIVHDMNGPLRQWLFFVHVSFSIKKHPFLLGQVRLGYNFCSADNT